MICKTLKTHTVINDQVDAIMENDVAWLHRILFVHHCHCDKWL